MRIKKNPLLRTRRPLLPPASRSRAAHLLTAAAAAGRFDLACCTGCGRYAWPVPEACPDCLSEIAPRAAPRSGRVLACTTAEVPADAYFRERAPWRVGLIQMDCGPQALAHLGPGAEPGDAVLLSLVLDRAGQAVLHAMPKGADVTTDPQWQHMTADPRDRRVLITDARHVAALPLARALLKAGAHGVTLGLPEAWKPLPTRAELEALAGVQIVPLDVTSDRSVNDLAHDLAGKVEILINTADLPRPGGLGLPNAATDARAMMETVSFGLMRLGRAFGPAMAGRGSDGDLGAVAWVNLLSVFGRVPAPGLAGLSAAHAAALALSQAMRAEFAPGGVRLMTVLAGPTEDDWFQTFANPKVSGKALADAVLDALRRGLEEVVVGDMARDLLDRFAENPKAVERELAQGRF